MRNYNGNHKEGKNFTHMDNPGWLNEAYRTGDFFPGKKQVRPLVDFGNHSGKENNCSCPKKYAKSDTRTLGIFTVQCVCSHPKLIGVSVMRECECKCTALSVPLTRFQNLPRVFYYDNACNMFQSITLRFPWVYNETVVVCDRYQYHSHTCNSICDPDSYMCCEERSTSAAESINYLWNFSKSHLRFLRPDNLMQFLALRSIFLNVRSYIRRERKNNTFLWKSSKFTYKTDDSVCVANGNQRIKSDMQSDTDILNILLFLECKSTNRVYQMSTLFFETWADARPLNLYSGYVLHEDTYSLPLY